MSFADTSLTNEPSPRYTDTTCSLLSRSRVKIGSALVPTPPNHFFVNLEEFSGGKRVWTNPHASIINKPFKPVKSTKFINQQAAEKHSLSYETGEDGGTGKKFTLDPFVRALCSLQLRDLVNLSETSICCYLATKAEVIWQSQFVKFFPHITPSPLLTPAMCNGNATIDMKKVTLSYPTEWQFKIYFKRMTDELKIYEVQFKYNEKVFGSLKKSRDTTRVIQRLVGKNYNGSEESISPNSEQGRCLFAKKEIPIIFDKQVNFYKMMDRVQIINLNLPGQTCDPLRNSISDVLNNASSPQLMVLTEEIEA